MAPRSYSEPADPTPPFLTPDVVKAWIDQRASERSEEAHRDEIARIEKIHAIELKVGALAGNGFGDIGSVGRLQKSVDDFIQEQRASNSAALEQRNQQSRDIAEVQSKIGPLEQIGKDAAAAKKQLGEIKQIPVIIRDLWKLVVALVGGAILVMTLWSKLHPEVKISPQQLQQMEKGTH